MEKSLASKERNLNQRERDKLIRDLVKLSIPRAAELTLMGRWIELEPYIELTSMMGELRGNQELNASQKAHLRKMIALQTKRLPKTAEEVRVQEFLNEVYIEAASELTQVEALPEDTSDYKRPWNNVLADLVWFDSQLKSIGQ